MFKLLVGVISFVIFITWVSPYLYVLASWKSEAIIAIINIGVLSPMAVGAIITSLSLSLYFKMLSFF